MRRRRSVRLSTCREYHQWECRELRARLIKLGVIVPASRPALPSLVNSGPSHSPRSALLKQVAPAAEGYRGRPPPMFTR